MRFYVDALHTNVHLRRSIFCKEGCHWKCLVSLPLQGCSDLRFFSYSLTRLSDLSKDSSVPRTMSKINRVVCTLL